MSSRSFLSTEEYLRTPETLTPTELVYGVMRAADSPLVPHQAAVKDLGIALDAHVRERGLGEVWFSPLDVILDARRHLVVQPDLFFVSGERSHIVADKVWGAPDLVIEVLSPNPRIGTLEERLAWFAEYDVKECWLLHQRQRRLEVVSFAHGAVAARVSFDERSPIQSRVLPDFTRTLASILRWGRF